MEIATEESWGRREKEREGERKREKGGGVEGWMGWRRRYRLQYICLIYYVIFLVMFSLHFCKVNTIPGPVGLLQPQ